MTSISRIQIDYAKKVLLTLIFFSMLRLHQTRSGLVLLGSLGQLYFWVSIPGLQPKTTKAARN